MRRNVRRLNREVLEVPEVNSHMKQPVTASGSLVNSASSIAKEKSFKTSKDKKKIRGRKAANLAELQR